jgi:hypothetical protein
MIVDVSAEIPTEQLNEKDYQFNQFAGQISCLYRDSFVAVSLCLQ